MKKALLLFLVFGIAAFCFTGCEEDALPATPITPSITTISFGSEALHFSEADTRSTISLQLTRAVAVSSEVVVQVASTQLNSFTFSPALQDGLLTLTVPARATTASFDVLPVNNTSIDGNKTITFTIKSVSGSLAAGEQKNLAACWADDESPALVTFSAERTALSEADAEGKPVTLTLSHPAPEEGKIVLTLGAAQGYGTVFTTLPATEGSTLSLTVPAGATSVSFRILPVNDQLYNATRTNTYTITHASGGVAKGILSAHALLVEDDELAGRAKGYTTAAGLMSISKTVIYAEDGKVARIEWIQNGVASTETWHYTAEGEVAKVVKTGGREVIYIRENGRVVKSEEYANGLLKKYTLYGYDAAGHIGETAIHDRQPDGTFVHSLHFVFLYYTHGNLFKKIAYYPVGREPEDYELISTDTYSHYTDTPYQFGIEIIPGESIQSILPGIYTHQTDDQTLTYTLTYDVLPSGQVQSRTASRPGQQETTYYEYY